MPAFVDDLFLVALTGGIIVVLLTAILFARSCDRKERGS